MITGELKSKVDRVWDAFWSGGISNPLEVIEQITYLLFIRRLDDLQTLAEKKAHRTGEPIENPFFLPKARPTLRWSPVQERLQPERDAHRSSASMSSRSFAISVGTGRPTPST